MISMFALSLVLLLPSSDTCLGAELLHAQIGKEVGPLGGGVDRIGAREEGTIVEQRGLHIGGCRVRCRMKETIGGKTISIEPEFSYASGDMVKS